MTEQIEDLDKKMKELNRQKAELENKILESLVDAGKAFRCQGKGCKNIVNKHDASEAEISHQLCWTCLSKKRKEERKKDILNKLKYARIVDIETEDDWSQRITRLTVYKQGMMYELEAIDDEGDAYLRFDKEWKEDTELPEEEIKPWDKKRAEQPLVPDVPWIINGKCINKGQSICNLGWACDGCPWNK